MGRYWLDEQPAGGKRYWKDGANNAVSADEIIGEDFFLANVLPIKKSDNIAVKAGKGLVNSVVSTLSAPGEVHRQMSLQGGSLLTGQGLQETPKNTTFTGDILYPVLPKKTVSGIESWQQEHPILGGATFMTVEALADPTTYIGTGGAKQALLKREGLGGIKQPKVTPENVNTDITPGTGPAPDAGIIGETMAEQVHRIDESHFSPTPFSDILEELQPRVNERITAPLESRKELVNYIYDHFDGEISKNEIRKMSFEEMVDMAQTISRERKGDLWGTMKTEGNKLGLDVEQLYRLETDPEYRAEWERLRAVSGLDEGVSAQRNQAETIIKSEPAPTGKDFTVGETIYDKANGRSLKVLSIVNKNTLRVVDEQGNRMPIKVAEVAKDSPPGTPTAETSRLLDRFDAAEREARRRIAERNEIYKPGNTNIIARNPLDDISDLAVIGAAKMARTGIKFEQWAQEMIAEFGEIIRARLPEIWTEAKTILSSNEESLIKASQGTPGPKVRSLGETTARAEWTSPELRRGLQEEMVPGGRGTYDPIANADTLEQARLLLEEDADAVTRRILSGEPTSATDNTAGMLLVQRAQEAGDFARAVDLTEALAARATEQGQAIQALSMWGRLTPEGMLRYGQKVINRANAQNKLNGVKAEPYKLSNETAKRIVTLMREAEALEGRAKEVKVAQALDEIAAQVPPSMLRKVSTIHTMAQLLNPKTAIRNIVGNAGFQVWENVSDVIGTGLDVATSAFTGQRSKVLPSLVTQGKGMEKGFKLGLEDALLGIDTSAQATKFDLPQGRTFRGTKLDYAQDGLLKTTGKAANNFLAGAEKAMNIELRATDRAFYQAAYDESLRQQMAAAAKVGKRPPAPTEAMKEIAHHDGLYRTFQDDNALSAFFQGFKRLLNDPAYTMGFAKDRPMREFGAGDFIIKYPRTPANLLARGLEYSPAGLLKTLWEASRPLMGREFNQKAFVESFSRAITGSTSGVGLGAALHRLGVITGGPDEDWDMEALNQQAGFGQYRLNVSGLKRFVKTFDPEEAKIRPRDITISYDWFQPAAISIALGADIDQNKGQAQGVAGTLINAFTTGVNAFAEQPVAQGIQTLFGQKEPADAIPAILKGIPASFVPTLLSQVKQLVDNQRHNSYDPAMTKETLNRAQNRIPGLAGKLPQSYGTLGQPLTTYQPGSMLTNNNPWNVFFNPAFVNKYAPTPEAQMVLDIYKNTGETSQVPHTIRKYFNIPGGEKITLTAEEYSQMQKQVGELTQKGFARIPTDVSDEEKIKLMGSVMTDAGQEARMTILEKRGIPLPAKWMTGAGYVIRAVNHGDPKAATTFINKSYQNNAYSLYEYGKKHGMVDDKGNPDEQLTRALSTAWESQTGNQARSAAYGFLKDACESNNAEQAIKWAGIARQSGLTVKQVELRIRQEARPSTPGAKTPTIKEVLQGGYDVDPAVAQRLLWAMGRQ